MTILAGVVLVMSFIGVQPGGDDGAAAKANAASLHKAGKEAPVKIRPGVEFLLLHMPASDLKSYRPDWLLANTILAYKAIGEVPWGRKMPEDTFLNYVLPYANLDETREEWRTGLYNRYIALAKSCKTPGEVALKLNEKIFADLNVRYHATKRPKPNQSPSESIKASYASCTGLSILLVDACRAVGVPARIAGTAMWFDNSGNHTWVEVWDGGEWKYLGAAEPGPFNKTWFSERASKADPNKPRYAIYAVTFKRSADHFVLSWNPGNKDIPALNVTTRYLSEQEAFLRIFPKPTESKLLEGTLVLKDPIIFELLGTNQRQVQPIVDRLSSLLKDRSYKIRVRYLFRQTSSVGDLSGVDFFVGQYKDARELGSDGYELSISPESVCLRAKTIAGISRGMDAFMQLIPESSMAGDLLRVPCVKVRDIR